MGEASGEFILEVFLKGNNAKVNIEGRVHSTENFSKKWNVKIFFQGDSQEGVLNLRGIAEDGSVLEFDGGAVVEKSSAQAKVLVSEKVVLFDGARGKCVPVLRVETDDVASASHAASIAPFDEEQILFATSRGMDEDEAVRLFKEGFLVVEN